MNLQDNPCTIFTINLNKFRQENAFIITLLTKHTYIDGNVMLERFF